MLGCRKGVRALWESEDQMTPLYTRYIDINFLTRFLVFIYLPSSLPSIHNLAPIPPLLPPVLNITLIFSRGRVDSLPHAPSGILHVFRQVLGVHLLHQSHLVTEYHLYY